MRLMFFMSRVVAMVIAMVGALLIAFVLLDIIRTGPHARGFLLGTDIWHQMKSLVLAVF